MKQIKLSDTHYIVVDEVIQPVNCYYYDSFVKGIRHTGGAKYAESGHCWQITHSTQPLGFLEDKGISTCNLKPTFGNAKEYPLSLAKEIAGEVDVENMAHEKSNYSYVDWSNGYNKCLEDNKDKKYTEHDIDKAIDWALSKGRAGDVTIIDIDNFIQSIQPPTEWEVEIVQGKLKRKNHE